MSRRARVGCTFQALVDEVSFLPKASALQWQASKRNFVKSPVLHLSDGDWNNLVTHWSRLQRKVLSMISHHNLNYISAFALMSHLYENC